VSNRSSRRCKPIVPKRYLLDQLLRQLPEGVYLKNVRQVGARVNVSGYAQSNARVSTLMRNIEGSPWLATPELVEIKSVPLEKQKVNEFTLNLQVKRLTDSTVPPVPGRPPGAPGAPGAAPAPAAKGGKA
jgi:type IV pilus assembly protein PilN